MSRLFLSSYFAKVAALLPDFAGDCHGKKVAFIPTASLVEKFKFYVKEGMEAFEELGAEICELDVSSEPYESMANKLESADFIFISGGNTFFLLQELRRSGADKLIAEQVGKVKVYIGESAGSIITAPDIEYIKYMDSPTPAPELKSDFSALKLVDFCTVPHSEDLIFNSEVKKIVSKYSGKLDLQVISNKQVILTNDGGMETVSV